MKNPLNPAEPNPAIENVHRAGMPGLFAEARDGDQVWRGAAGRPVTANLQRWNRLGSSGKPQPHPVDDALAALYQVAMYGNAGDVPLEER
ncbi:hypothetical protein [Streptosporangium sp. NPDC002607]